MTRTPRTRRRAAALIIATLTAAGACANPTAAAPPQRPTADQLDGPWKVVAVTDGDTIRVARADSHGATTSVRLLGVVH